MRSNRSSQASRRKDDSVFVPPQSSFIDKDTVFIKPDTSYTKNQEVMQAPLNRSNSRIESVPIETTRVTPWWVKALVGVSIISACIGGYYYIKKRQQGNKIQTQTTLPTSDSTKNQCKQGSFLQNGKCITCPVQTVFDGKNCVAQKDKQQIVAPLSQQPIKQSLTRFRPNDLEQFIHKFRSDPFNSPLPQSLKPPSHYYSHFYDDDDYYY